MEWWLKLNEFISFFKDVNNQKQAKRARFGAVAVMVAGGHLDQGFHAEPAWGIWQGRWRGSWPRATITHGLWVLPGAQVWTQVSAHGHAGSPGVASGASWPPHQLCLVCSEGESFLPRFSRPALSNETAP